MKSTFTLSLFALAAVAVAVPAQTPKPATHPAVHHTATAAKPAGGACLTLPETSPKIPALPAGSPCAKALYTVTRKPELVLEYKSPIVVGDNLAESLGAVPSTITLGYVDTKIGTGELAKPHLYYTVHYTGYLPDGTKFDSSVDRKEPITFPYGQHRVIPGWDTGFEGMHVGGKRRLFVPYQLAYGEQGRPPVIPAKSELIFDVELVAQSATQPPPPAPKTPPTPPKPATPPAKPATTAPAQPATAPASTTTTEKPAETK